jgi:hypothetical protein
MIQSPVLDRFWAQESEAQWNRKPTQGAKSQQTLGFWDAQLGIPNVPQIAQFFI